VLVADTLNWRIQRFTPDGVYLSTITSPIGFYYNRQMAVDADGNIYVSDASNERVQKFDAEGEFLMNWTNSPCTFFTPGGMAIDGDGNLVVVNASCDTVEKYSPAGEFLSGFNLNTPVGMGQLGGLAINTLGQILIADEYSNIIRVYSTQGSFLRTFGNYGAEPGQFDRPAGLALGPDGKIYVADRENNRVQVFDTESSFLWMISSDCLDCLYHPDGVAVNSAGNVFVADSANNRIMIYNKNGKYLARIGSVGADPGKFYFPNGNDLEFDAQDNLYVADTWNDRVQKINPQGNVEFIWQNNGGGYDIALADHGGIYVARQENKIEKYDSQGTMVLSWGSEGAGSGQFDIPRGAETDREGNVWVGDAQNHRVQKFDAQGKFLLKWAPDDVNLPLFFPNDIAIDPLGRINILDSGSQRIFVLDTNGNLLDKWSLLDLTGGDLSQATGLSYDRWGNLYVTDDSGGQVFHFQLRPYFVDVTGLFEPGDRQEGVALLSANAPGNTDPYTFTLVDGTGSEDNDQFMVQGKHLLHPDGNQAGQESFNIRVQVTNPWGDTFEQAVQVSKAQNYPIYLPMIRH
jgi:tripartite motif-containing protein 71